jgi:hypothetical protein
MTIADWRTKASLAIAASLCLAGLPFGLAIAQQAEPTEVFVLATLYRRHAAVPAYGHDTLRSIIRRVGAAVVVLDVSPRELRHQSVHPSKAEYPEVIFPLVREFGLRAYAGEPDEPAFSEIVTQLSRRLKVFREREGEVARADEAHERATFAALELVWRTPADVNGGLTDELLSARRRLQDRLAGSDVADAWRRWNGHAVAVVRRAVRENPGRRVLVLIGVENAALLRPALRELPEVRLIEMESWLRAPP